MGCSKRSERLIKSKWEYQEGYYIGDVIHFDKSNYYTIDNDCKIYKQGEFVATVKRIGNKKLEIKSEKGEVGFYIFLNHN